MSKKSQLKKLKADLPAEASAEVEGAAMIQIAVKKSSSVIQQLRKYLM